jgi:hypothetical protein
MHTSRFLPPFHLRKAAVFKILFLLEYQMMNKIQKSRNPKCYYTPLSEPFRTDCYFLLDRGSSVDIPALNKCMN